MERYGVLTGVNRARKGRDKVDCHLVKIKAEMRGGSLYTLGSIFKHLKGESHEIFEASK